MFENYDAFMVTGQQNKITCNREGILPMSIGFSGLDTPCCMQPVTIEVSPTHPLIQLAQVIPWQALADMALPDLQRTTAKGKWWLGRKLQIPTKQKRRSTGQGAKNPLDHQRPEKWVPDGACGHELSRPKRVS